MPLEAAHKQWWQISEVVFGIPLLVSIALQLSFPLPFPNQFRIPTIIIGVLFILVGLVVIVLARREMANYGQRTDPGHPTTQVVTSGVFSISRNPLYLGVTGLLIGIAFAFRLTWLFTLIPLALIACHYILIAPEEKYLTAKFGDQYRSYTARVHRWLGRTKAPSEVHFHL